MYRAIRRFTMLGEKYTPGDPIPTEVINGLGWRKIETLSGQGYIDRAEPSLTVDQIPEPTYQGRGWWAWENGIKVRAKKDTPMDQLRRMYRQQETVGV